MRKLDSKAFTLAMHAAEDAFNPFDQQKDVTAVRAAIIAYLDAIEGVAVADEEVENG